MPSFERYHRSVNFISNSDSLSDDYTVWNSKLDKDPFHMAVNAKYSLAYFLSSYLLLGEERRYLLLNEYFLKIFFKLMPDYENMNLTDKFPIVGNKQCVYGFSIDDKTEITVKEISDRLTITGTKDNDIMLLSSGSSFIKTLTGSDYVVVRGGDHIIDIDSNILPFLNNGTYIVSGGNVKFIIKPHSGINYFFIDLDSLDNFLLILDPSLILGETDEERYNNLFSHDNGDNSHIYMTVEDDNLELHFLDGSTLIFDSLELSDLKKEHFLFENCCNSVF